MDLPTRGRPVADVLVDLEAKRTDDVAWADGRTFGMVYDGGPSVHEAIDGAARMFLHDNALNTQAFPSLGGIQSEVVRWTADLLHGPETAAGFLTSGGTESILCAVLAARERAETERGIHQPEMVVAESAHAAFHKAAHLFGVTLHKTPVNADWRVDVDAMADAVNENTILVVGSAPQYPQGVVDPIPEIAALAASVGANCHVDACMGGFVLPFAEMIGRDVPPWDFRIDGVTSISADIHKLGYAPKGVSVVLHRTKELRRYQTFVFDGDYHLIALAADDDDQPLDMFALGDALAEHGWFHDRQTPPDSLHSTVSNGNAPHVDDYLTTLRSCIAAVGDDQTDDRATNYATLE